MVDVLGYCGMNCGMCPWYNATLKNDDAIREQIVENMKQRGLELKLADINCDGCTSGKRLAPHCQACEVRKSAAEKDVKTCANCDNYKCDKLISLYENLGEMGIPAQQKLDEIHKSL